MKRKTSYLVILGLSLLMLLSACGSPTPTGSRMEIVYAIASDTPSMDPIRSNDSAATDAQSQILEGLTRFNPETSVLEPYLAESYEQIEPSIWEFKLREGIKFSDGADFNADVVAQNLNRLLNIEEASPALFIVEMITEIEVVDAYTVRIHTEFPFAPLTSHLAHRAAFMVSPNALDAAGVGEQAEPIGTGPFVLTEWRRGEHILMERNDTHWGVAAIPDAVRFVIVPEPATRFSMLQTGEAHYAIGQSADVAVAETIAAIDVNIIPTTSLAYIGFNTTKGPLSDPLVRRAISHAINKDDIIEGIYEGLSSAATGPLSPLVDLAPNVDGLAYDVDLARELLAQSGYTDINITIWYNDGNSTRGLVCAYVQSALAEIGITVKVESIEWGAYLNATANGEHDMFILGWTTITGDADYGLYPLFHSNQMGDSGNRFFYSNPEVDTLLETGRTSSDRDVRAAAYLEASKIIVEEAPMMQLVFSSGIILTTGIDNVYTNFNSTPYFYAASLR